MDPALKRLMEYDEVIGEIARELGLDFFPQEFDVIPAQKMLEIMAYRFPVNYSHWSFGRDYEQEKTRYEHGYGVPYEVVLNSNPARAYLMNTNPPAVQAMVMAHVYAHNDLMKNNLHFKPTRRDILPSASEATLRFQRYEKRYGLEAVERTLDAALSIELNINPDFFIREESEDDQRERLSTGPKSAEVRGAYDDLLGHPPAPHRSGDPCNGKTPLEPERDLMLYIINHSPKPLKEWEKDILSVVRDQSRYLVPQRRTKIMNEGWATYWHMRIMERLFHEGTLSEEEHGSYNLYNARVLAPHPRTLNPYNVGLRLFLDIERRWDRGQFGKAWEECQDPRKRQTWDLGLGQGREKIFEVRRQFSDRFLIEEFLTEELIDKLDLYLYEGRKKEQEIQYVVKNKEWRRVKGLLVSYLSTFDTPLITVEDGDYQGKRELYLKHAYEGIELDHEYREKTMEEIYYLWGRPVHLESVVGGDKRAFTFDGTTHE